MPLPPSLVTLMNEPTQMPKLFADILDGINKTGVTTILVIIFLLMYMGILPSGVSQAIDKLSREHTEVTATLKKEFNDAKDLMVTQQTTQLRLMRQICRNTAKSEAQAVECDR